MGILRELNIVKGKDNKAERIFESLFDSFLDVEYDLPSQFIKQYWKVYENYRDEKLDNEQQARNFNGKIFEYILATLLIRERIYPLFMNAKVAFVPNINYDLMLYSSEFGPICLSAKTSFRERYKQADLEAIALKYVHRRSKSYLLTLSDIDAAMVNKKQKLGDVIGLDKAICATSNDFDVLIEQIKKIDLIDSPSINVITSNLKIDEALVRKVIG